MNGGQTHPGRWVRWLLKFGHTAGGSLEAPCLNSMLRTATIYRCEKRRLPAFAARVVVQRVGPAGTGRYRKAIPWQGKGGGMVPLIKGLHSLLEPHYRKQYLSGPVDRAKIH